MKREMRAEEKELYSYPNYPDMADDFTVDQGYEKYTQTDHNVWKTLYNRQLKILPNRACQEYLDALKEMKLQEDRIPDFEKVSEIMSKKTGWRVVAVPGLIPAEEFFIHLSECRFPVTHWIRKPEQIDYIEEPEIFHDFFGHVPLLMNPYFANYMQAYGRGGIKAMAHGGITNITRLYWYTVEFGLIKKPEGLRIYGAGIVSSPGETHYSLESDEPNRLGFDVKRIMQTDYRIDDFQETYWVIDSFEQLMNETQPDFTPYYKEMDDEPKHSPSDVLSTDRIFHRGTGREKIEKRYLNYKAF